MFQGIRNYIYNASLRRRLLVILVPPFLVMCYFAVSQVVSNLEVATQISRLRADTQFTFHFSSIVHEIQKERGYTAGFVGSEGTQFKDELAQQRKLTDLRAKELDEKDRDRKMTNDHLRIETKNILAFLGELKKIRNKVDRMEASFDEIYNLYSSANDLLLHVIVEATSEASGDQMNHLLSSYSSLIYLKEIAGKERALVNNLLTSKTFSVENFRKWQELIGSQRTQESLLKATAEFSDWNSQYKILEVLPETRAYIAAREKIIFGGNQAASKLTAKEWVSLSTTRINRLRNIELRLAENLRSIMDGITRRAYFSLLISLGLFGLACIVVFVLSRMVINSILQPTTKAIQALRALDEESGVGETSTSPSKNGNEELSEILVGITQLAEGMTKAQQNLREQNKFIKAVLNSLGESLFVFDTESRISRINQSSLSLLGYQRTEILGLKASAILGGNRVIPECNDFSRVKEMIAAGEIKDLELNLVGKDKTIYPVFVTGNLLEGADGVISGYVLSARDARQSRLIEELRRTQDELITSAKFASVGELAGQIAHEINSPLGAIVGAVELIRRSVERGKFSEDLLFKNLNAITSVVERISLITHSMRGLALSISSDESKVFPVSEMIRDAFELVKESAKRQNVNLQMGEVSNLLCTLGNETSLSHATYCLLNSALHSVGDSKGSWIKIQVSDPGSNIEIRITDSSPGVDPEDAELLFKPSDSHFVFEHGTGFKLAVAQEIVARDGGKVFADTNCSNRCLVIQLPQVSKDQFKVA